MGGFRAEWVFPHYYVISMWLALLGLAMMWRWVILQRVGRLRGVVAAGQQSRALG